MILVRYLLFFFLCAIGYCCPGRLSAADFHRDVQPLLQKYCFQCHSGEDSSGHVDFAGILTADHVAEAFETWQSVVGHLQDRTMPPDDEPQPTDEERGTVINWYQQYVQTIDARPAVFRPRRLSVTEYRNTLRSVFGFDLQVAIIEAEQTVAERSLVRKLLPTDPPGKSGFKNDTHENPLTTVVWDQYSYLIDAALEELFSPHRRTELELFTGPVDASGLTIEQAKRLLREFLGRARRRPLPEDDLQRITASLSQGNSEDLTSAVRFELKTALMSPAFMYRGLLLSGEPGQRQHVDSFELAERLSYFLWADMPDERLSSLAANGTLNAPSVFTAEFDRMLASPKANSLADVFATEWLTLNEIEHVTDNVPLMAALKSQPIDFMRYLFTSDRPLIELIDSDTAFINPHTSRMYGKDAGQMKKYVRPKGIEVEIVANQKIQLQHSTERGGILTMPGVLAMNKGPILRGTWMLEQILGQELPDPPANVGQVPANNRGEELTFRQRFEQHRSNATCAVCHDKIDPLGFALESFDRQGKHLKTAHNKTNRKQNPDGADTQTTSQIDTSGRLPSGETFKDIEELKKILTTSQRKAVIRNIVERTMSYALCRKLIVYDVPTVDGIVEQMSSSNGTWRDLFLAVTSSVPFRETILSEVK